MTTQTKLLNIDNNKGLLFPAADGKALGAVKVDNVYYEVSNSSTTVEEGVKTLNVSLKKLGGRKSIELHITRSKFEGDKAPSFVSNNFIADSIEYQVVGWSQVSKNTGKTFLSLAVNEVQQYEFNL